MPPVGIERAASTASTITAGTTVCATTTAVAASCPLTGNTYASVTTFLIRPAAPTTSPSRTTRAALAIGVDDSCNVNDSLGTNDLE